MFNRCYLRPQGERRKGGGENEEEKIKGREGQRWRSVLQIAVQSSQNHI